MSRPRLAAIAFITLLGCAPVQKRVDAPAAGTAAPPPGPPDAADIVNAPDRTPEDREMDGQRKPAALLAFLDLRPGQRVAELVAGRGYTAELLARAVGPTGRVYGHNTPFVLQRFAEKPWTARLARPAMANVVRLDRELEDPFPQEIEGLDLVVMILFYHDTYWFGTDRARMNRAVLRALKPGGSFVVIDHAAAKGAGAAVVKSHHRIEEDMVKAELLAAGFHLESESDFLRNAADARDWNVFDETRRGTSDRFALRFVKPR
ncbi:MAG: SAM-dependent methyltransferase [Deltaproteobacteria bacterium]|nr:SAM-dependent methyltransferase [Deltaproteobacteria bacterium]